MGKSTISMVIFNSYVKLPEGKSPIRWVESRPNLVQWRFVVPPAWSLTSEMRHWSCVVNIPICPFPTHWLIELETSILNICIYIYIYCMYYYIFIYYTYVNFHHCIFLPPKKTYSCYSYVVFMAGFFFVNFLACVPPSWSGRPVSCLGFPSSHPSDPRKILLRISCWYVEIHGKAMNMFGYG